LKLSLGLLFGISNILSFWWGNSKTYFVRKRKKEKNVDNHGPTKKIETRKKIKSKKNGLLKKMFLSKIKRQTVLLFYPF